MLLDHLAESASEDLCCPLCSKSMQREKYAFLTHLSTHLEEIALAAIPRAVEDDIPSTESEYSSGEVQRGTSDASVSIDFFDLHQPAHYDNIGDVQRQKSYTLSNESLNYTEYRGREDSLLPSHHSYQNIADDDASSQAMADYIFSFEHGQGLASGHNLEVSFISYSDDITGAGGLFANTDFTDPQIPQDPCLDLPDCEVDRLQMKPQLLFPPDKPIGPLPSSHSRSEDVG